DLVVAHSGFAGQTVTVLVEDGGRIVGSQDVVLPDGGEPVPVRVHFTAETAGPRPFRFRIAAQDGELVLENNEQRALIDVRDGREKILYFEGEPRHEVAFLRRAIAGDENLQLVTLQRTAENKYLRLAVDSAEELLGGFPTTREELFRYRGLILGSVEASHFTHEQLRIIADFVGERGGGLLMLGGRHAFAEGGWAGTPVEDVLPVTLDPSFMGDTLYAAPVKVELTRAGHSHFVTQLAGTEAESEERWRTLPELTTLNRVDELKPGATALLSGSGTDVPDDQIVLAYQRFGRGHSIVLPVWDTWLWQMHADIPLEDMTHETFWRQLLRWLVTDVPGQVTVATPSDRAEPGEAVRITADVGDAAYLRVNSADVVARVTSPSGTTIETPLEWTVDRDGEYHGAFTPDELGLYTVEVAAESEGQPLSTGTTYLDVAESTSEYFDAQMRRPLLERIAEETGGRFYTPETLASLPEDLTVTGKGATVVEEKDLWDMPFVLLVLVGLMASEWGWRRRRGLA
ncbi:MAG: glutamine amidotransferase, partial [Longimicrobiales bacterium]